MSRESLAFGMATFLKLATMMLAGLVLLATTRVEELFLGLVRPGRRLKCQARPSVRSSKGRRLGRPLREFEIFQAMPRGL